MGSFIFQNYISQKNPRVRKTCVRNSGPEMGALILWTPGIFTFFLQENLRVHKIPRFRGGGLGLGRGECRFYFYGRGIFLNFIASLERRPNKCSADVYLPLCLLPYKTSVLSIGRTSSVESFGQEPQSSSQKTQNSCGLCESGRA